VRRLVVAKFHEVGAIRCLRRARSSWPLAHARARWSRRQSAPPGIHEFGRILIIDPEECIDCGACEPEGPVEAIFPEDALRQKWESFVKINYAFGEGADVVNKLLDDYAI
jgi:NAD-dependent dihydropyrimidine dehydrogenase PreA subunit